MPCDDLLSKGDLLPLAKTNELALLEQSLRSEFQLALRAEVGNIVPAISSKIDTATAIILGEIVKTSAIETGVITGEIVSLGAVIEGELVAVGAAIGTSALATATGIAGLAVLITAIEKGVTSALSKLENQVTNTQIINYENNINNLTETVNQTNSYLTNVYNTTSELIYNNTTTLNNVNQNITNITQYVNNITNEITNIKNETSQIVQYFSDTVSIINNEVRNSASSLNQVINNVTNNIDSRLTEITNKIDQSKEEIKFVVNSKELNCDCPDPCPTTVKLLRANIQVTGLPIADKQIPANAMNSDLVVYAGYCSPTFGGIASAEEIPIRRTVTRLLLPKGADGIKIYSNNRAIISYTLEEVEV